MDVTRRATACHVPNGNLLAHYGFKGLGGMKHVAYFITRSERQAIQAETMSDEVIMDKLYPLPQAAQPGVCEDGPYRLYGSPARGRTCLLGLPPQCAAWRKELIVVYARCRICRTDAAISRTGMATAGLRT